MTNFAEYFKKILRFLSFLLFAQGGVTKFVEICYTAVKLKPVRDLLV